MSSARPPLSSFATVMVISVITIVLQLVHTRLLSFMFWSHVVYLVVYLALLGYGTAGAVGALLNRRDLERPWLPAANLAAFAVSNVASIWLVGHMAASDPTAFTMGAQGQNLLALVGSYSLCAVPFFFLGMALVSTFARYRESFNLLYAVDLAGAALGGIAFVALLAPVGAPRMVLALSGAAALGSVIGLSGRARLLAGAAGVLAAGLLLWTGQQGDVFGLRPHPSKIMGASMDTARNPGFRLEHTSWNPVGRLDIFRPAAGTRLDAGGLVFTDAQHVLTYDGDAFTAFPNVSPAWPSAAELETHRVTDPGRFLQSTPYLWHRGADVLVIGTGGGADIWIALFGRARRIDGVEINRSTIEAMTGRFADASGRIYLRPNVRIFAGDGRSFLMNTDREWDVMHMTGIDTFLAASNGSFVMAENYLYTVEAIKSYFTRLRPAGVYTCVRWEFPGVPRETLRVFSNALQALRELGVPDPHRHLVVTQFPPGNQAILMMQRSPFTEAQIATVLERARTAGAAVFYVPSENPVPNSTAKVYAAVADAFRSRREEAFFAGYPYDVSPVRDDRPFFYQYYKASMLLEAWRTGGIRHSTAQHGYWPFIVLAAVLVQAFVLVALFIFVPLGLWRRSGLSVRGAGSFSVYFAALGMGYIMIELALMQKFSLLLGDPIYSIVVVLGSMLVFTGIGSFLSGRVGSDVAGALPRILAGVAAVLALILLGLDPLVHVALGTPLAVRAFVAVAVSGLLCLGLGFFFPLGVRLVNGVSPAFLPWAWGINGGFSVIGSVGTVAIALGSGFRAVILIAGLLYVVGVLGVVRSCRQGSLRQAAAA